MPAQTTVTVRLFAAAAEAAGTEEAAVPVLAPAEPLAQFLQQLPQQLAGMPEGIDSKAGLSRICGYSSFLINGVQARPESAVLTPGDTLDVLPPFAGG